VISVRTFSLRDYDATRYGPFLGVSDDGSAAEAIRDAALASPKARALSESDPLTIGVGHDAERLRSVGEVPVGPEQYERIQRVSGGCVLITTNVGSHVNLWHYLQPPAYLASQSTTPADVAGWSREYGAGLRGRPPEPWLRVRFEPAVARDARIETLRAAAAEAPVCVAVRADQGRREAAEAIDLAAAAGARAVVVDGTACPPTEGRAALPGLLNYFDPSETRELLRHARERGIAIGPALKIDTDSVSNQIWTGLYAAHAMGLHLGKYGLFPLTFQEMADVVGKVQRWMRHWTAAPVFYVDVPWVDEDHVYELADAREAAGRWLDLMAEQGAAVVLIDTVDKSRGRHLVRSDTGDETGIFSWDELAELDRDAARAGIRVLWAGGIPLSQVREFGRRHVFGVYVTSAATRARPLSEEEVQDIGLTSAKAPVEGRIALVKLLLEAGFFADPELEADGRAAERGDSEAQNRLASRLVELWRERVSLR
jgi:hypothetical protein